MNIYPFILRTPFCESDTSSEKIKRCSTMRVVGRVVAEGDFSKESVMERHGSFLTC